MMTLKRSLVFGAGMLLAGGLRWPVECAMRREFLKDGLLEQRVEDATMARIKQVGAVTALGGLRTLVATFWNLNAATYFENQNWAALADAYDTIVELAPRTSYYWQMGGWQMSGNAVSYYRYDAMEIPALRRKLLREEFAKRGRAFFAKGVRYNPDSWRLRLAYGMAMSDFRQEPDYAAAAKIFREASQNQDAPSYVARNVVYALARVDGQGGSTLREIEKLWNIRENRAPMMAVLRVLLTHQQQPEKSWLSLVDESFATRKVALDAFRLYEKRLVEGYPFEGVAECKAELERAQTSGVLR